MDKKVDTAKLVLVNVDEKLAFHLKNAEEHLIEAVKLFSISNINRRGIMTSWGRLTRAQELVTWLHREELIRIRGPIKVAARVSKRKK